jgi:hydroxymethylpyrimidine pyrophosphatase-like HAD family hydrolase
MGLPALLASGRPYPDLARFARGFGEWDGLIAEDGAVVEAPLGRTPLILGRRVAATVRRRLEATPALQPELGRVVASVPRAQRRILLQAVTGLPVTIEANIDRLMVVPTGLGKRAGIRIALRRLGVDRFGYAAIGDAENDLEMLRGAALSGAVANAIPAVRAAAEYVCRQPFDRGVLEFVSGPLRERVDGTPRAPPR